MSKPRLPKNSSHNVYKYFTVQKYDPFMVDYFYTYTHNWFQLTMQLKTLNCKQVNFENKVMKGWNFFGLYYQ